MTTWPSGLRRYVQVVFLVGVGSNPTVVIYFDKQYNLFLSIYNGIFYRKSHSFFNKNCCIPSINPFINPIPPLAPGEHHQPSNFHAMNYFRKVYQQAFPTGGGGYLRRYMNVHLQLVNKWLTASKHPKPSPTFLTDFSDADDAADARRVNGGENGWRTSADSETIGGYSKAFYRFVETPEDYRRILQDAGLLTQEETVRSLENQKTEIAIKSSEDESVARQNDQGDKPFIPFIRWYGTLNTKIGQRSHAVRSGYCALKSPFVPFEGHDLGQYYNHLEVTVRADGRPYSINMKLSSYFPDDLYVYHIRPTGIHDAAAMNYQTGGAFTTLFIPFKNFVLTANGRVRDQQRALDGAIRIEAIGFTLMDGNDGDFCFDLARIRAVNYDRRWNEVLGEDDEDAPY